MAYQGFGHGIAEDGAVIGKFVAAGLTFFVSTSFSKSFSLYGERVGALSVLCENKEEAARVLSQLKIVIRTNYCNPPTHGGAVVADGAERPGTARRCGKRNWPTCACASRQMRQKLVDGLKAAGVKQDMSFITTQIGMFSYSGLTKDQMVRLRERIRRLRHRHRPHVRGRAQQQEHRLRLPEHRQGALNHDGGAGNCAAFGLFRGELTDVAAASAPWGASPISSTELLIYCIAT